MSGSSRSSGGSLQTSSGRLGAHEEALRSSRGLLLLQQHEPQKRLADLQKRSRIPNCADLGSPTAVIWPKVGDGFVGYPGAEVRVPRHRLRRFVRLKPSTSASS